MMAEAVDWDDLATASRQAVAPDAWHVALAPDDVKVVSLEQLDDMFRLSLVDSETRVWQPGMTEWVSLGEVAGLDEEPLPQRSPPKPPSPRSSAPSPRSLPPPPKRAPAMLAPDSFYAEPLQPFSYAAPLAPIPSLAPIASVRPLVVSHTPYPMPQQAGSFGRFIVALALVAGVGVTLYRNDILRDAAHSIHQDARYAQLEQKLGGPSFGTLRAVEQSVLGETSAALAVRTTASEASTANAASTKAERAVLANDAAAPTPNPIQTAGTDGRPPPVVSLESLGTEKRGATSVKPEAKATVLAVVAGARTSAPSLAPKAAPFAKAPLPHEPRAVKPGPLEKPAQLAAPSKSESELTPHERLNAEIAKSMLAGPATAKKSKPASSGLKGSSEYDPLNPKL